MLDNNYCWMCAYILRGRDAVSMHMCHRQTHTLAQSLTDVNSPMQITSIFNYQNLTITKQVNIALEQDEDTQNELVRLLTKKMK